MPARTHFICTFDGCGRPHAAHGLCRSHRNQQARGAELRPLRSYVRHGQADAQRAQRSQALLTLYGITLVAWEALFAEQGSVCALCGADAPGHAHGWATDHCHGSGTVRGILCHTCNIGLGLLGDSADRLRRALAYVGGAP